MTVLMACVVCGCSSGSSGSSSSGGGGSGGSAELAGAYLFSDDELLAPLIVVLDAEGGAYASVFDFKSGSYTFSGTTITVDIKQNTGYDMVLVTDTAGSTGTADVDSVGIFDMDVIEITDVGAMEGSWTANLSQTVQTTDTKNLTFDVDSSGAISNLTGLDGPISGYMFLEGSDYVMHINTGETDQWTVVGLMGTGNTTSVSGTQLELDTGNDTEGTFTVSNAATLLAPSGAN